MSRRITIALAVLGAAFALGWNAIRGGGIGAALGAVGLFDVIVSAAVLLLLVIPPLLRGGDGDLESLLISRLERVLPRRAAKLVSQDVLLFRAIALLLLRRSPRLLTQGARHARYDRSLVPLFLGAIGIDLVVLVVLHLTIPSPWWRVALDVISILGLVWFVGFLAGLRVYAHEVGSAGLRLRFSSWHDVRIAPLGNMALTNASALAPVSSAEVVDGCVWFPINGMVNVQASCPEGFAVTSHTPRLDVQRAACARFWVDDPQAAITGTPT